MTLESETAQKRQFTLKLFHQWVNEKPTAKDRPSRGPHYLTLPDVPPTNSLTPEREKHSNKMQRHCYCRSVSSALPRLRVTARHPVPAYTHTCMHARRMTLARRSLRSYTHEVLQVGRCYVRQSRCRQAAISTLVQNQTSAACASHHQCKSRIQLLEARRKLRGTFYSTSLCTRSCTCALCATLQSSLPYCR